VSPSPNPHGGDPPSRNPPGHNSPSHNPDPTLYLADACYIDWRTLAIRRGDIAVHAGARGGIELVDAVPRSGDVRVIACGGRIVTRSFVVAHHHIYSALARGMPPPSARPRNFVEILERIWWNLDKKLDMDMIRASAYATAIDAARSGCTFIIDHHASPHAARESLHVIAEALEAVGLSHLLCYELSDRDGPDCLRAGVAETEMYLKSNQGLVGLHASFTVSDALLDRAVGMARDRATGVHIHVAEDAWDQQHCEKHHGVRVVQRLHDTGVLDFPTSLLAHCLHLNDMERDLVHDGHAWVVQNTQSNQNNAVGTFDARGLGDRILLGTDGMHSDMLSALRASYLAGQSAGGLSPLQAYRRLRRAHEYLDANGFMGDGDNNLVVLDYPTPTAVTQENWPAHCAYGLGSAHVRTVIAKGKVVVEDGVVTTIDAERELARAAEAAQRLWARL
jgi:cytosine/adenosine deaminase-related metal-dependent hydrolase